MNMSTTASARAPWRLVIAAGLFLAYSALAVFDDVMGMVNGADYYRASGMTASQVLYFSSLPLWVSAASTASVWAGFLGALALILRRRVARPLFAIALFSTTLFISYTWFLSEGIAAMGMLWFMPAVIAAIIAALLLYAVRLSKRGVLR